MPVLDELGWLLDNREVAKLDVSLFLGVRPETPDDCLTVYEYPGGPPEYVQNKIGPNRERVQIQVVGRGRDYPIVRMLVKRAWDTLSAINGATIQGTRYQSVMANNSPGLIGRDSNDRLLIAFNASVEKEIS